MGHATGSLHAMLDLTGKVAVVTGGSRGLGLQICEALGEFGARVVLAARKPAELEDAAGHLRALGIETDHHACDLASPDSIAAFAEWLAQRHAAIDILVNNAGATWGAAMLDHPLSGWQKVIDVNLTGTFLLTQEIGRRWMVPAGRGRIVNVASIEGLIGHDTEILGTIAYNTAKGGMVNFTRALAAEWGGLGITVNALAPGFFASKMTAATLDMHGAFITGRTPRRKLGGPEDMKGAALLFCSDAGAHINGQILAIDGGFTAI